MLVTFCTAKLHRVKVTGACLDYQGSITIDRKLMDAAGILPFQMIHVNNLANAAHWETYAIPGDMAGEICLNGSPARLFHPGDVVIILVLAHGTPQEAATIEQKIIFVNDKNDIVRIELKSPSGKRRSLKRSKKR